MRYIFVVLAAVVAMLVSSPAHADGTRTERIQPPTRAVETVRVTSAHHMRGVAVIRFNTGSKWRVVPCKWEDSNNCYWNARTRGNGYGTSFVTLRGKTYPIRK